MNCLAYPRQEDQRYRKARGLVGESARCLSTLIGAFTLIHCADGRSVELSFHWRPGMTCQVVNHMTKEGSRPLTLRYTMKVVGAEDGDLLVSAEEPEVDTDGASVSKEERELVAADLLATNMPPFRVRSNGQLVGVSDLDQLRRTLREVYESALPQPADPKALDRAMEIVGSPRGSRERCRTLLDSAGRFLGRGAD